MVLDETNGVKPSTGLPGVTEIIRQAQLQPERLADLEKFRRHVVVLFTDIKGSTAYFEKYGDAAGMIMVHGCNETLRQIVEGHDGVVVKTIGDAIMATFEDCPQAVRSAIEMQKSLITFNASKPKQDHVFIRIGINYGAGIVRSNHDVFGDVVNVASRVESVAQPKQIVISGTIQQQLGASQEFRIHPLGRYNLKGKEEDCDLFEVLWGDNSPAHTVVAHITAVDAGKPSVAIPAYRLVHIKKDGSVGQTHKLGQDTLTLGKNTGDVRFPSDPALSPLHAQFTVKQGQVQVEDLSQGSGIFVRLVATYTLRDGDQILMGRHTFEFRYAPVSSPTDADAGGIPSLPAPAELVVVQAAQRQGMRFLLDKDEIIFGRSQGTYVFADDGLMSRGHAKIYQRGEDFFLEDLNSRNGTFIRVRNSAPVPSGAAVILGGQLFRLEQV